MKKFLPAMVLSTLLGTTPAAAVCEPVLDPVAYTTATTPRWVATGDFNEDGITDLAVAANTMVSILAGRGMGGIGNGVFKGPANLAVSGSLQYMMVSDFNDDGIQDLAVTNTGFQHIGIIIGLGAGGAGNGTFAAAGTFAAGGNPQSTVAADFNEDGITDIGVANGSSNTVSILMGQGSGGLGSATFVAAVNYATGVAPARMVTGDFNEDGITDLAVSNSGASNSVSILIGQGTGGKGVGTFLAAIDYPTNGSGPLGITTGDFNEDGVLDLAVVNANSSTISILRGNGASGTGNGTFTAATHTAGSSGQRDITAADFDGDGITDLGVSNIQDDGIHVLFGLGSGTVGNGFFSASTSDSVGQDPRAVIVGNFDGNGSVDIATVKSTGSAAAVLLGGCWPRNDESIVVTMIGGSDWPVATEQSIGWSRGEAVMAVNIEVSRDGGTNWKTIATNVTDRSFQWTVTPPATGQALLRVSDSMLPNRRDVGDLFTISDGVPACDPLAPGVSIPAGADPRGMVSADFNEDGIADLAVAEFSIGGLRVLLGNGIRGVGNGTYHIDPICPPVAPGPSDLIARDFNGDGITDLAAACRTADLVAVLLGKGSNGIGDGTFQDEPVLTPVGGGVHDFVSGDFNEDGIADLAVACINDDTIAILIGKGGGGLGTGSFNEPLTIRLDQNARPTGLVTGDFDEDGILDIASVQDGTSNVVLLRGLGSQGVGNGSFSIGHNSVPLDSPPSAIVTGDFNSDGITDLAVTSPAARLVTILTGRGSGGLGDGSFAIESGPFAIESGPFAIDAGDFNLDGITDLVVTNELVGEAQLLYGGGNGNRGDGTFAFGKKFETGAGPTAILVSDFLEDGMVDVFVLCNGSEKILPLYGNCQSPGPVVIDVLTPDGGEVFPVGGEKPISWTKSAGIGAVDVELSRDAGANWEPILINTIETSHVWTVTPPLTTTALIRVSDHSVPNRSNASNGPWAIATQAGVIDGPGNRSFLSVPQPNPSAGVVRLAFSLPVASRVTIEIYDVTGRLVRQLEDSDFAAGDHVVTWDGSISGGPRLTDGLYFVRAGWSGFEATQKILRVGTSR